MNAVEKYRKVFHFGKIAYNSNRRVNEVTIEAELRKLGCGEWEFSACGNVWNSRHSDIVSGGQMIDRLVEFPSVASQSDFNEILDLWRKYHLNGLKVGTHKQVKLEELYRKSGEAYDYDKACEFLKKNGLYVDKLADDEVLTYSGSEGKTSRDHYEYGWGWVLWKIPEDDLKRMFKLLDIPENA